MATNDTQKAFCNSKGCVRGPTILRFPPSYKTNPADSTVRILFQDLSKSMRPLTSEFALFQKSNEPAPEFYSTKAI
jgi:hypothetical protein